MYQPREYRKMMNGNRFKHFNIRHFETDLWIGIDPKSYLKDMEDYIMKLVVEMRNVLEQYESQHPGFFNRMIPAEPQRDMPEIIVRMCDESERADVGPMAAVAGAFSESIGQALLDRYEIRELVIENGGDCYLKIDRPATVAVFAGNSPLSEKVGIIATPEFSPFGICTSSGTVGHSLSFGKADAVMIASKNTTYADAMATSFANRIACKSSAKRILTEASAHKDIVSTLIVFRDQLGYHGQFEMAFLNHLV